MGRGTCCTAGSFSEYSPSNCQEKYFSISSSGRKRNEENLKIHKTKQQKTPADCPHSHSLSLYLSFNWNVLQLCVCSGLLWDCSGSALISQQIASIVQVFFLLFPLPLPFVYLHKCVSFSFFRFFRRIPWLINAACCSLSCSVSNICLQYAKVMHKKKTRTPLSTRVLLLFLPSHPASCSFLHEF